MRIRAGARDSSVAQMHDQQTHGKDGIRAEKHHSTSSSKLPVRAAEGPLAAFGNSIK